jgi:hypothetical protein
MNVVKIPSSNIYGFGSESSAVTKIALAEQK